MEIEIEIEIEIESVNNKQEHVLANSFPPSRRGGGSTIHPPPYKHQLSEGLTLHSLMGRSAVALFLLPMFLLVTRCQSYATVEKERTLAMIKPDGLLGNYTDNIKEAIQKSGFNILREMMVQLDETNASLFYAEHSTHSFFPVLITYMTSGPVYVMVLEKVNAIADWRTLIGPTDARKAKITHPDSIRALCGSDSGRNCVHGSDSPKSAEREISFFFGEMNLPDSTERRVLEHDEL